MAIVTSYDWESDSWTHNGDNPARTAWREAVAEIAAKAHDKLLECNGRVDSAVKMVLAGDVEMLADGTARVASQSNGQTATPSQPVQPDAPTAQPEAPTAPLPEAPASVNVRLELGGREVQLTLRDADEGRLLARLEAILQRFPLAAKPVDDTPHCPKHGVAMKLNHGKDGSTWYSHKTADGWCKGK